MEEVWIVKESPYMLHGPWKHHDDAIKFCVQYLGGNCDIKEHIVGHYTIIDRDAPWHSMTVTKYSVR